MKNFPKIIQNYIYKLKLSKLSDVSLYSTYSIFDVKATKFKKRQNQILKITIKNLEQRFN